MKIAILGSAASVHRAPFRDARYDQFIQGRLQDAAIAHGEVPGDWDIWGCSPGCWAVIPRATRWFEVHRWEPQQPWFSLEYRQFLQRFKGPVYTGAPIADIPNHVVYPIDRMEAKFASYFFTSSLALMLALAIDTIERLRAARKVKREMANQPGPPTSVEALWPEFVDYAELEKPDSDDTIGMWGVDMAAAEEYCVAPQTSVLTADLRWIHVSEVEVGDELIGFDEKAGGKDNYRSWRKATVLGAKRLTRPCFKLYLEDGTTLVSSKEHRWLTYAEHETRWCTTDKLVTKSHRSGRPTRLVKLTDVWGVNPTRAAGYLAAAFDGEGHLVQSTRTECNGTQFMLGFSQRDNAMSEKVKTYCRELMFDLRRAGVHKGPNGDCVKYRISGGRPEILRFLGSIRPHRLLDKFDADKMGVMHRKDAIAVERAEYIGEQEVIGLHTSTGTFVAEGFASHNSYQRPGCQHFVLEALRRGIKFYLPPESDLMRPMPVYGISEWDHNYVKLTQRARELNARKEECERQAQQAATQIPQIIGEIHGLNAFVNTWTSPYGLPHGVTLELLPGEGLGGGVTHLDSRPLESRNAALQALKEPPRIPDAVVRSAQIGDELIAILSQHVGENGTSESAAEVLRRIVSERDAALTMLQRDAQPAPANDLGERSGHLPSQPPKKRKT